MTNPRHEALKTDVHTIEQVGAPRRPHLVLVETGPEASPAQVADADARPAEEYLDDWRKVEAARTNPNAFDELCKEYEGFIRFKASGYFLRGGDAQDLVQEAMIGFYKGVRDYDGQKSSLRNFLDLCISRQIITAIKADTRKKHDPLNQAVSFETPSKKGDDSDIDYRIGDVLADRSAPTDDIVAGQESLESLLRTLTSKLSPLESDALRLFMEGDDYQVMAQKLGVGTKSIDNALQRMKRKIERHMITQDKPTAARPMLRNTRPLNLEQQQKRLNRLYESWATNVRGSSGNNNLAKILSELEGNPAARKALLREVCGYLALIALDSEWENPIDAYRETHRAVIQRAMELPANNKLSETHVTDALIDAALQAVRKPNASAA